MKSLTAGQSTAQTLQLSYANVNLCHFFSSSWCRLRLLLVALPGIFCLPFWNWWDPTVLDCPQIPEEEHQPVLREELEAAVKALKMGKSTGVDNMPTELIQAGEAMIEILTSICNKIWKTGDWPSTWTQSLIITLSKKGNLQLCQNYRTINLISHPSKVLLKIILNRLQPQA